MTTPRVSISGLTKYFGQTLVLREADDVSADQGGGDDEQAEQDAHARGERTEHVPHG